MVTKWFSSRLTEQRYFIAKHPPVRREAECGDDIVVIQRVQMLSVVQIPKHRLAILPPTSAQTTIRGHRDRVEVSRVSRVINLQLAVGQIPDLDHAIPAGGHDDWIGVVRREAYARHPVIVPVLLDRVLALCQRVPQLYGLIPGAGHDLSVVHRKGYAEHVLRQTKIKLHPSSDRRILLETSNPVPIHFVLLLTFPWMGRRPRALQSQNDG